MQSRNGGLQLSATDLSNFLGCKHRTALDMAVAMRLRDEPPEQKDDLLELLWARGLDHEKQYVDWLGAQGHEIIDLSDANSADELVSQTEAAMRRGVQLIVQGGLRDGHWFGKPDILHRVETKSQLGDWSYEVYDTKLSRKTKAGTILQLSLYTEMVSRIQGTTAERFYVVSPRMALGKPAPGEVSRDVKGPDTMMVLEYRTNDYAAYFRLVRQRMTETAAREPLEVAAANYPDPVPHCVICRWAGACDSKRRADDHLSLIAGISRLQRRELEAQGITTLTKCAATWPLPADPKCGSVDTYENAHKQALIQLQSKREGKLKYELRPVIAARAATDDEPAQLDEGLCRLPEPTPGDVFLDLEGDPYAVEGGREYMIGLVTLDGDGEKYHVHWGFNDHDERSAFEQVMDLIAERRKRFPGMHVYHYAPYETTAFRKLRLRYETRATELDAFLAGGVFVDLYAVVRQGLRVGAESYSIKKLEPLYGFDREVDLKEATRCRNEIEKALGMGQLPPADICETVRGYNEDDCVSTLRLRDWLEKVRAAQDPPIPRPTVIPQEEREPTAHEVRVGELRPRLLVGIPDDPTKRSPEQQARYILAYLIDYHRREALASFWEYWRLRELPEDELEDEPQAITGLEFVARVDENKTKTGKPTGVVTDRYRYPHQEMEIERGDLNLREGGTFGVLVKLDRLERTVDIKKRKAHKDYNPSSVFAYTFIPSRAQEDSLFGIAERVAEDGGVITTPGSRDLAARRLLLAMGPTLKAGTLGAPSGDIVEHLITTVAGLDQSVLPVQGPPGAGKTYAGAAAICALVKAGKNVGVTANSHAVIRKLLDEVAKAAKRRGEVVTLAHRCEDGDAREGLAIKELDSNEAVREALDSGAANVVGGTSWVWAHSLLAGAVDVLFVDEAGQMALANVVAMSPSAGSVVLLGDPQQLQQPKKAAHPDGVDASALEHLLDGHATVPDDRGIFLPVTWRMCPSVTAYTSEMFYEGRLASKSGLEHQVVTGANSLSGSGLRIVFVDHDGNRSYSNEEVSAVLDLARKLTTDGSTWTDENGKAGLITGESMLVVAPYNAQVSRLQRELETLGIRAGTVDKFQGQEAAIVIYSMATSRPEDAPRGMDFLYNLNRFNVATSRARCVAVVVASRELFEPECSSPRQMRLANALCRFRELSDESAGRNGTQ